MRSAVNVLKERLHISDPTKREDTQPTLFDINAKLVYSCCCGELSSVYHPLAR